MRHEVVRGLYSATTVENNWAHIARERQDSLAETGTIIMTTHSSNPNTTVNARSPLATDFDAPDGTAIDVIYRPVPEGAYDRATLTIVSREAVDDTKARIQVKLRSVYGNEREGTFKTNTEVDDEALAFRTPMDTVMILDPKGDEVPLTPVFGAQIHLTLFVAGDSPENALERAKKALEDEFGPEPHGARIRRAQSRPVAERRVDVRDGVTDEVRALNVLEAEARYLVPMPYTTTPAACSIIVGE